MTMSTPTKTRTFAEVAEQVSRLRSKKAINLMLIAHLKAAYKDTDAGAAEMRVYRDDLAYVSQPHLESSIMEFELSIDLIDAEIEELQNQPMGGGTPPAAQLSAEVPAVSDPVAEAIRAQQQPAPAEKKGTGSARTRTQGGGPS